MQGLLLDTHIWIWFANGDATLPPRMRKEINEASQQRQLYIAAISVWELGMLETKGRITLGMPSTEWVNKSIDRLALSIAPLSQNIALESCALPGKFHADPADRMIIATARVEELALMTRDTNIIRYGKQNYATVIKA